MSYSKEEIYKHIKKVLVDQFEIDAESISLDADMRDDLDIDSIDAVDLMIELKSFTVKKIALEDFQDIKTVENLVDVIFRISKEEKLGEKVG